MQSFRRGVSTLRPEYQGRFDDVDLALNPGGLAASVYVPLSLEAHAPLVVVLHGCTQTALDYANAAGWLELADRHGFAVLLPQQQRANNANLCFNWFERGHVRRGEGEAASIKAMIDRVVDKYDNDDTKIFITGLSAGAAMAGSMLACYPETFAGGGLIAGLPHGTASSMASALQQMRSGSRQNARQLGANVTEESNHRGPWPRVSIWHGDADRTVNSINGDDSLAQWLAVHGLQDASGKSSKSARFVHRTWQDRDGSVAVEHIGIAAMGHGTPIDLDAADAVGRSGPFVLDAGIASSVHLLAFWGVKNLAAGEGVPTAPPQVRPALTRQDQPPLRPKALPALSQSESGIAAIINDALRSAGLMK